MVYGFRFRVWRLEICWSMLRPRLLVFGAWVCFFCVMPLYEVGSKVLWDRDCGVGIEVQDLELRVLGKGLGF